MTYVRLHRQVEPDFQPRQAELQLLLPTPQCFPLPAKVTTANDTTQKK